MAFGHFGLSSRPEDISWKVVWTMVGVKGHDKFQDSTEAEEAFQAIAALLKHVNDRVILYRIHKTYRTYQDPYKFAVMSPRGVIFRYAPYAPTTWQDAERIVKKHQAYRREYSERRRS